jgi:hypothetical protein
MEAYSITAIASYLWIAQAFGTEPSKSEPEIWDFILARHLLPQDSFHKFLRLLLLPDGFRCLLRQPIDNLNAYAIVPTSRSGGMALILAGFIILFASRSIHG